MKVATIKYSNEYVKEIINKEVKRRQLKQLRRIIKYIGYILICIGVLGIAGAVGSYENNNMHPLIFALQMLILSPLLPTGAWFAGWFNECK